MKKPVMRRIILSVLGLLVLGGLIAGGFMIWGTSDEASVTRLNYGLVRPRRGDIMATVDASGSMQAAQIVNLDFSVSGIVAEILVDVGDKVQKGDPLARLDAQDLVLGLEKARASLDQAVANYEQLKAGASPEEIRQASAQVQQAQGQLNQMQGDVTQQDIVAAQSDLEHARAVLAKLEAGPDDSDVQVALANLDRARANLVAQRDTLSAAKTQSQLQMEQSANALRDRQASYSRTYWDNRAIEREWSSATLDLPQEYKEREESALRSVQNAESALEQARVAYDEARQAEITGIQAAEADVRNAQASLDSLLAGADADERAAARAQVAQAEARLEKLVGAQRSGSLTAAEASLESAQARLDELTTPPREVDIASALAQVELANISVEEAQVRLDKTTLTAPIVGTVAEVNLRVGESERSSVERAGLVLVDLSRFYVYVTIDEIDVAQVAVGQEVYLTLDALPELEIEGVVDTISPLSNEESAVASYVVRIESTTSDPRVRSGMSVNADIVVGVQEQVLLVPRRAVYAESGTRYVDILTDATLCDTEPEKWPLEPDVQVVEVTTGLSNDQVIEIEADEIAEDVCIFVEGVDARMNPFGGPPPGARERRSRQ